MSLEGTVLIPKIIHKTGTEMTQSSSYSFGTTDPFNGRFSPISHSRFCSTYLLTKGGQKIDTNQLTEQEVLKLISQDLNAYFEDRKKYAMQTQQESIFSYDLVDALKEHWNPSCGAIFRLKEAEINTEKRNEDLSFVLKDLISRIDKNGIVQKAEAIAQFNQQSRGEHGSVSKEEVLRVLDQMVINEQNKEKEQQANELQR